MRFEEALADLDARQPEHMPEPGLERIAKIVKLLDDPQLTYPTIHITGTNGKTTTARLASALACAQGLTTGTFISPHVERVTERLSICGQDITEEEFGDEWERLQPYLREADGLVHRVTYFEALTALAYLWFADKPVALGVFEVGLGGTWDATNLVRGDVAVLCPIGLDHTQVLGPTVEAIAREKAGIVKAGRVAVVREQPPPAMAVIAERAEEVGARLLLEGDAWKLAERQHGVGGQSLRVEGLHGAYEDLFLPLFGDGAARSAAAAIVACEALLERALDEEAVRRALRAATSPGRMEVVSRHPVVILDGGHNPDALGAVAAAVRGSFTWGRLHAVIGMYADKDVERAVAEVAIVADTGYACRPDAVRAAPADRVADALREAGVMEVYAFGTVADAVDAALSAAEPGDLILVTGSFSTVGEARPLLRARVGTR